MRCGTKFSEISSFMDQRGNRPQPNRFVKIEAESLLKHKGGKLTSRHGAAKRKGVFKTMKKLATLAAVSERALADCFSRRFPWSSSWSGSPLSSQAPRQAATYLPATATVDKVTGTDEAADKVSVEYSFSVHDKRYTGTESADDEDKSRFNELRQFKAGQQLTIYYDPRNPAESQLRVKADASGLAFSIFALPFLAVGLNQLWLGLTGRAMIRSRRLNAQSDARPRRRLFRVFVLTCVAGTSGQLVLCFASAWPWSLAGGLIILFVAIPAANLWANRLARRWRSAKAASCGKSMRRGQAARAAGRGATTPTRTPKKTLDAEAYLMTRGSLGKKLAIALGFTIVWCGITGLFGYFAVGSLVRHHYATFAIRLHRRRGPLQQGQDLQRQQRRKHLCAEDQVSIHGRRAGITSASNTILRAGPPATTPMPRGP